MKRWSLYLLFHPTSNRTYLGVTTDVFRRLRQHRCQISGGARFTTRIQKTYPDTPWLLVCFLNGFESQSEVTRYERLLKLKTRGLKQRKKAVEDLSRRTHPQEFSRQMVDKYIIPDGLTILYHDPLPESVA